jgi:uncharacterized protein YndB with AHSA1/START domain
MLKWVLFLLCFLTALIVLPMAGGMFVPRHHVVSSTVDLGQPIDTVWSVVSDLDGYPTWWLDVKSMERVEEDGEVTWVQRDAQGQELPIEVAESMAPHRFATTIADEKLPFGGIWKYEMEQINAGTRVTVREEGEIFNPVFRLVSHYVLGYHGTIDRYLRALGSHFNETVVPVHLNQESH